LFSPLTLPDGGFDMRLNTPSAALGLTSEGAPACRISPEQELRRTALTCLLWEDAFYEDGESIADRIESLCGQVSPEKIAALAIECRKSHHLRHVPLLLLSALVARGKGRLVSDAIATVISRPDEITELVAIYWRKHRRPLSNQMKKGLARAFQKFDEYSLAKYASNNSTQPIKLRDVLFLVHAKPKDSAQAETWKSLIDGMLRPADTWEVSLSAGCNKRETFERLLREGSLGYLAVLRNLRNMDEAGVDRDLIRTAILARRGGANKVLPFRFVAAARAAPSWESTLDIAMLAGMTDLPRLSGRTICLVDVSGSMDCHLSARSDLTRLDAAATLAASLHCEDLRVFTFSNAVVEVPPRRGMAGIDAIKCSQPRGGTYLGFALESLSSIPHDRLIVITDEQSHDRVPRPAASVAYMINVSPSQNGVGYSGAWTHLDGFSENILRWIAVAESGHES
jgi:60 kDa SS-A/Ro ribonucleoprotein